MSLMRVLMAVPFTSTVASSFILFLKVLMRDVSLWRLVVEYLGRRRLIYEVLMLISMGSREIRTWLFDFCDQKVFILVECRSYLGRADVSFISGSISSNGSYFLQMHRWNQWDLFLTEIFWIRSCASLLGEHVTCWWCRIECELEARVEGLDSRRCSGGNSIR
jgi:hypothetical protein